MGYIEIILCNCMEDAQLNLNRNNKWLIETVNHKSKERVTNRNSESLMEKESHFDGNVKIY